MTRASPKEQIILAAEQLFALRGIDGVSLRHIGNAAGNANNSAVQYHFGSKDQLVQAIFEHRLPLLDNRRRLLLAEHRPADVRAWVECYVRPILEQGEQEGSHYLGFVAMVQQSRMLTAWTRLPTKAKETTEQFLDAMRGLLTHVPEPLRMHRVVQGITFAVHAAAVRERTRSESLEDVPFAVHMADVLDGVAAFLEAPVSRQAVEALRESGTFSTPLTLLP